MKILRFKQPRERTVCQTEKSKGMGHLLDLLCATRIGRKAPRFLEERGHKMVVFANDYIGILINQFGRYEKDELALLFTFLKPIHPILKKGNALDIGANIGNHSLYFSDFFATVYAFEPHPVTYSLLKINAGFRDNIIACNMGLGDEEGSFLLRENRTNMGASSVVSVDNEKTVNIQIVTLDMYAKDISDIVFLKIDVEGFEEKVLKGGLELIRASQPLIVFEQDSKVFDGEETPSIRLLRTLGYRFCWQETPKRIQSDIWRKCVNFYRIVFHSKMKIVTDDTVPKRFHSMLVAVPPRFFSDLHL